MSQSDDVQTLVLNALHWDLAVPPRRLKVEVDNGRLTWFAVARWRGEDVKVQRVSGDIAALLARFSELRKKACARTGKSFPIVVIQEAGLDGFWIHRVLLTEGIESHVVDAASIATSRRRRRAKTDRIDGETLLRALLAHKRGEPRVCSMVRAPTPEDEDRRRICRERKVLIMERVQHVNRIKGLLFSQGASGYEPLRRDRRARLEALQTGDGRRLPQYLKAQVCRELDRLELLLEQIKAVEAERDALLDAEQTKASAPPPMLLGVDGVGPEFASVPGLLPRPWKGRALDLNIGEVEKAVQAAPAWAGPADVEALKTHALLKDASLSSARNWRLLSSSSATRPLST